MKFAFALGLFGLLICLPSVALANPLEKDPITVVANQVTPTVQITEIAYNPSGNDIDHEWVEIANFGGEPVAITLGSSRAAWRFSDGTNHVFNLHQGSNVLASAERAILTSDGREFQRNHPNYSGTIFKVAMSLANSSDTLALSADGGTTWFGEQSYSSDMGGNGDDRSLEWTTDGWKESREIGGSPGYDRPPSPLAPSIPFTSLLAVTEIHYNPLGADADYEWLEIQNVGSLAIPINTDSKKPGWRLRVNGHNHPLTHRSGQTIIYPGGRLIIARDYRHFLGQHPEISVPILEASFSLTNSGGTIELSWDGGQSWPVVHNYKSSQGGSNDGRSLEREPAGGWRSSVATGGTPGNEPQSPLEISSTKIVINEFVPYPESNQTEWIELANAGDEIIDLAGWKLDDSAGGSPSYTISANHVDNLNMLPNSYLVLDRAQTKLSLSNSKDSVRLFDPTGRLVETIPYQTPPKGAAWARISPAGSNWTAKPTPGADNELVPINKIDIGDGEKSPAYPPIVRANIIIDQARSTSVETLANFPQESGWHVTVTGRVVQSRSKSVLVSDGKTELMIRFRLEPGTKPAIHKNDSITVNGLSNLGEQQSELIVLDSTNIKIIEPMSASKSRPNSKAPPESKFNFSNFTAIDNAPIVRPQSNTRPTIISILPIASSPWRRAAPSVMIISLMIWLICHIWNYRDETKIT